MLQLKAEARSIMRVSKPDLLSVILTTKVGDSLHMLAVFNVCAVAAK